MVVLVRRVIITAILVTATGAGLHAQPFPTRPVRILTSPVGGGNDFEARILAKEMTSGLGQPIVIENRPTSALGDLGAKASPDGYTLVLVGGTLLIAPLLAKMDYDPIRDFAPISLIEISVSMVTVNASVAAKSISELIALAKAKPGSLNYAASGIGAPPHLAAELFNSMAGTKIVQVNYKGTGPAVNDLIGGQVQVMFASISSVMPHVKSGRLRALAVTGAQPTALAPGLPSVASSLPGYEATSLTGMYAPAKTPAAVIARLNKEIVTVINRKEIKEFFLSNGAEMFASSPQELAKTMKSEIAKWGKVIKDAGVKLE